MFDFLNDNFRFWNPSYITFWLKNEDLSVVDANLSARPQTVDMQLSSTLLKKI